MFKYVWFICMLIALSGCGQLWMSVARNLPVPPPPKLWLMGGFNDGTGLQYNTVYTTSNGGATWSTPSGAAMPVITSGGGVVTLGSKIYYIGGTNPAGNANINNIFSTSDGVSWNTANTLPAVRGDAVTLVFNGCLFEIGGTSVF